MTSKELLEKHEFEQEDSNPKYLDTPDSEFPKPVKRYKLILETFGMSIEEPYFWILNMLREGFQFVDVTKLKDVFTATETSSFFGLTGTRLERQQAQASQYLAQIGIRVKEIFGQINELKKIDVRLEMYRESSKLYRVKEEEEKDKIDYNRPESQSAEGALKNLWIELIEGGAQKASSVYGLAREVGFLPLPDLFFANPATSTKDVDKCVDGLEFPPKVKHVLKSKLFSYFAWKEQTFREYSNRRKFLIKFLRQTYEVVKTYMNWLRPYLLHAYRLKGSETHLLSADIVGAFEQAMIEVEFLAQKPGKKHSPVILANFLYKTRPALEFHKEGQQHRGAIHVGRVEITLRGYSWTKEQIEEYKKYRSDMDVELIGAIDASTASAMEMLRDDLKAYLKEAGKEVFKEDEKPEKKPEKRPHLDPLEPFKAVFKGFAELARIPLGEKDKEKKLSRKELQELKDEEKTAEKEVQKVTFLVYNIFKKAHLMPSF